MVNVSQAINQEKLDVTNKVIQSCGTTSCSNEITQPIIIVGGSCPITFNQQCSVDASCVINNILQEAFSSAQNATAESAQQLLQYGINVSQVKNMSQQDFNNAVAQSCGVNDVHNLISGPVSVIAGPDCKGAITFNQIGDVKANCVLSNAASIKSIIDQQAKAASGKAGKGKSNKTTIFIILGVIVGIAVLGGIIAAAIYSQKRTTAGVGARGGVRIGAGVGVGGAAGAGFGRP